MDVLKETLPPNVQVIVNDVLKEQGFEDADIFVTLYTKKGENYLGTIYGVQAAVSGKKMDLIVKMAPVAEGARIVIPIDKLYEREIFVYENILTEFDKMQVNADIPKNDRLRFPKCYKTSRECLNEIVILEDLKASGFKIFNRLNNYDFEHARLTLEAIGKYHAHSFVLQRDDPEKYAYFVSKMQECIFTDDVTQERKNTANGYFSGALKKAVENLDSEELKEKLNQFNKNVYDQIVENLKPNGICVFGHGDCWSNNMMYKYKDGKPVEIRLLDFQVGRYSSPILDVMYFIFCSTDHDLRNEHYEDMLKAYHNGLRDHLAYFSLDVEKCYPWSKLLEDLKKYLVYIICITVNNVLVFTADEKSASTINDFSLNMECDKLPVFNQKPSEIYKRRINGLISDFYRFEYL